MDNNMHLILLLVSCTIFTVGGRRYSGYDGMNSDATDGSVVTRPACGQRLMKRLGSCCSLPKLISADVMSTCAAAECGGGSGGWERRSTSPPVTGVAEPIADPADGVTTDGEGSLPIIDMRAQRGKQKRRQRDVYDDSGEELAALSQPQVPGGKVEPAAHRGRGRNSGYGGRHGGGGGGKSYTCIADCAFRNQSLIASDDTVDMTALADKITASVSSSEIWQPLVKQAMENCKTDFAKVNMTQFSATVSKTAGGRTCNPGPSLMMTCLRRHLAINCPASSSVNNDGEDCASQMTSLKSCDPFIPCAGRRNSFGSMGRGRGSGGLFGVIFPAYGVDVEGFLGRRRQRNRNYNF